MPEAQTRERPAAAATAPTTAAAVANEFILLSRAEPNLPAIDQMKLQKLLFYAHAWHLAIKGKPLFDEDFEAWPWGPVVRHIYSQTRRFGRAPVEPVSEIGRTGDGPLDFNFVTPEGVSDPDVKTFIRAVWDVHKHYSAIQLSNSTHAPGEPWTVIRDRYNGNLDHKPKIPNDLIEAIFRKKLENGAGNTSA